MKIALNTALLAVTTFGVTAAQAALPASVATTFTSISSDVQAIFDLAFPIVMLGLGLVVVIKLVKRFGSKI